MKKRIISLILALVMVIGMIPFTANASEIDEYLSYEVYEGHVEITGYRRYGSSTVVIPSEIEGKPVTHIAERAFWSHNSLTTIVVPDSVTYFGAYAFSQCTNLTSIHIPDGITAIEDYTFENCSSLTNIDLPDSVTSINYGAFIRCSGLANISIPDGVTYIGSYAFHGCTSLTAIDLPDSVTSFGDGVFWDCTSLTDVSIPNRVTYINYDLFRNCASLTEISIPDSVTSIGSCAFMGCSGLTSIFIPASVSNIGTYPFANCSSLNAIHVDANNQYYSSDDQGVLFDKAKREVIQVPGAITGSYVIPNRVTSIDYGAFMGCSLLTGISIPDGVNTIRTKAFSGCSGLTSIILPTSVNRLDDSVFMDCTGLAYVNFQGDAPKFGTDVFKNVTTTAYYPPDNATWTEEIMQDYGGKITWGTSDPTHTHDYNSVVTAPTCTEKGFTTHTCACGASYVTDYISALGHDFADSICTRCGFDNGFQYTLHTDHVEITGYFGSATDLAVPTQIEDLPVTVIGELAFCGYPDLNTISIPDGVTSIGECAFYDCSNLTSIDLPDSITSIGRYAFHNCSSLTSIDLPDSLTSIDDYMFNYCSSLASVSIPEGVASIGSFAFSECTKLSSITIPASVTIIDTCAFAFCDSLTSIFFKGRAPQFGDYIFRDVTATAYYPADNSTWTTEVRQNYWGKITWTPYDPFHTHEYTAAVTAPTCTGQGFTIYSCDCGDSYSADNVDALGHDYADGTCTRCGEADPDHQENPFNDVPTGEFYEQPVLWALENKITTGTSDNSFSPLDQCLRAQVVTFLWRAEGTPEPGSYDHPFVDVTPTDFFYKPVLWALENKITTGIAPDCFGAISVCNRAQVVTFLWRAAGCPEPQSAENPFTDVTSADFFYKPVLWALENGITTGISSTEFGSLDICNRAQVVTFLYRAYN